MTQISENMYVLCATWEDHVRYAPMYIISFRLVSPSRLLEAQLLNQQYHSYEEISTVQDRLRWCRHHRGLMQKEAADLLGISRAHYTEFEDGIVDCYPKEIVDRLAAIYQVPADDFLDDYNRFLYYGQGRLIQEHRQSLGLGKRPYARLMKMEVKSLRAWESEKKRVSKSSWEKYFKDVIQA